MPTWRVELKDGRVFEVEADTKPSESEVMAQLADASGESQSFPERFSQAGIGLGATLLDAGQFLAGVPGSGNRAMRSAEQMGISSPEAMLRTDPASVLGRGLSVGAAGAIARPAAAGAELLAGLLGSGGEMVGRAAGGEVGGAVGGITGALSGGLGAAGLKQAFGGRQAAQANQAASAAIGTQLSLGETQNGFSRLVDTLTGGLPGGNLVAQGRAVRIASAAARKADDVQSQLAGRAISPEAGGRALKKGFEDFKTRANKTGNALYDELERLVNPASRVRSTNYQKALVAFGGGENVTPASRATGGGGSSEMVEGFSQGLADTLSQGPLTMGQLSEIRKGVGRRIADMDGVPGLADQKGVLDQLYKSLTEDLEVAAIRAGKPARRAFQKANGFWKGSRARLDAINSEVIKRDIPSKIFAAFETSARSGPETARAIRKSLSPDQFDAALRVVFRRMGQETPGGSGATGLALSETWDLQRFLNNWRSMEKNGGLAELLKSSNPAKKTLARDLSVLAETAHSQRQFARALPNPSGTANRLVNLAAAAAVTGSAGAFLAGLGTDALLITGSIAGTSFGAQKMLENPRFINWLASATKVSAAQIPAHVARLQQVAEQEPSSVPAINELINRIRP